MGGAHEGHAKAVQVPAFDRAVAGEDVRARDVLESCVVHGL
jgi:hypothetical protein